MLQKYFLEILNDHYTYITIEAINYLCFLLPTMIMTHILVRFCGMFPTGGKLVDGDLKAMVGDTSRESS